MLLSAVGSVAQSVDWQRVPGGLVQTSADADYVWGVNADDVIVRRPTGGTVWERIPGGLVNVSATGEGWIWGVNRSGEVFKCAKPCDTGAWVLVPGRLSQVSGGQRFVWGVNSAGQIFKRFVDGSGQWKQVPGGLKHVSASASDLVWGVNGAGEIYRCAKPCEGGLAWERVPGALTQVSANDREVWGVNAQGQVWYRPVDLSSDWQQAPSGLVQVSATGRNTIWGVNARGEIYTAARSTGATGLSADSFYSFPVSLGDLDAIMQWIGSETSAIAVDYCYRNSEGRGVGTPMLPIGWTQAPGKLAQVSATGRDAIWGVNSTGEIYTAPRPMGGSMEASVVWQRVPGGLVQLSADADYVWGVNADDVIVRRPTGGTVWERIRGDLINISATGSKFLWGVRRSGEVVSCEKPCDNGDWVPSGHDNRPMTQVSAGQGYVWGVNSADQIFKRPEEPRFYPWRQIPGGLKHVSASASDLVWGVNGAGEIYRCAKPCEGGLAWERVLGALTQVSANDREVWGVNAAGDIFHLPKPCPEGMEEGNGLCYRKCRQDWAGGAYGDGPVCWQQCPTASVGQVTGQTLPYNCGIGCARDINACASALLDQISAPINLALNIISFGTAGAATSGATAASGGAAAATSGVTKAALASTQRWNALLKALEQAQSIAETAANVQEVFGQVEALETELDRWIQDAGANFSDFTSPRIERIIEQQFPNPDDSEYIKRKYALFHFNTLLEQDGWRLGKLISGYAGYEPTGIVSVIDAFVHPVCRTAANPFPSVTILAPSQRTPDRSMRAN